MASIQATGLSVPSHPVLYGTTLAVSLAGSIAALGSSGVTLPGAQIEEALGVAGKASASEVAVSPAAADTPAAVGTTAPAKQASPDFVAAQADAAISAGRGSIIATSATAPMQQVTRLEVPNSVPVPPAEPQVAAPEAPAAALAVAPDNRAALPAAAEPAKAAAIAVPESSFAEAFQAVPEPSLAVPPQPVPAQPAAETVPAPAASVAMVADQQVPSQVGESAAALVQPALAAPIAPVAPAVVAPAAAPAPESAAPALVAQPEATPPAALAATAPSAAPAIAQAVPATSAAPAAQPLHLESSPQLRKFDLARLHVLPPAPPASLAQTHAKPDRLGKAGQAGARDKLVDGTVFHRVAVTVAGSPARTLELRIGADMKPSIKVGDLLGLVSGRMDPASVARFESAASAQEYVSLADLRAAGFNIVYNAGTDSISIAAGE